MSAPILCPARHRLLLVSDVDLPSSASLAEHFLQTPSLSSLTVDALIMAGNCASDPADDRLPSAEEDAAQIGSLTCLLSQLENIVCRVLYVPGDRDPFMIRNPTATAPRLTPNSRNLLKSYLKVSYKLSAVGACEPLSPSCLSSSSPDGIDSDDDEDLVEQQQREARDRFRHDVQELVRGGEEDSRKPRLPDSAGPQQSILVTSLRRGSAKDNPLVEYLQTEAAQRQHLLHVASLGTEEKLDASVGDVRLVVPGSLSKRGDFALVELRREGERWRVDSVDFMTVGGSKGSRRV